MKESPGRVSTSSPKPGRAPLGEERGGAASLARRSTNGRTPQDSEGRRSYLIPSVQRAMLIIQQLSGQSEGRTLGELCRALGMPKSTAFGILTTLQTGDFVRRDPNTERYRLSYRILEIGGAYAESLDLVQEFLPVAKNLVARINESVHLGILDGRDVVHLSGTDSSRPVRLISYPGRRLPSTCTALGKVLLAALDDAELGQRLGLEPLPRLTEASIRTLDELRAELSQVRLLGYARDREESAQGVQCVAAPVLGPSGTPVAAIAVSLFNERLGDDRLAQIVAVVKESALQLSRSLGYRDARAAGRGAAAEGSGTRSVDVAY